VISEASSTKKDKKRLTTVIEDDLSDLFEEDEIPGLNMDGIKAHYNKVCTQD